MHNWMDWLAAHWLPVSLLGGCAVAILLVWKDRMHLFQKE